MIKKVTCLILLSIIFINIMMNTCFASGMFARMESAMGDVSKPDTSSDAINHTIQNVIKMIQFAGTGIALIVITIYGIKYMLASPADKAEVKKQIFPILIGCGLLFATVNIVGIIADMTVSIGESINT